MQENRIIHRQGAWGGKIAAYLFLAGAGAGAYLAAFFIALTRPEMETAVKSGLAISLGLMIGGILFLLFDLGKKFLAFLAFARPADSWISRGTIIITLFVVLDMAYLVLEIQGGGRGVDLILGSLTALLAVLTLTYTGMVLGAARPVVFWDPAFLTVLFLISGISSGLAALACVLSVYDLATNVFGQNDLLILALNNAFILTAEAVVIGLYLSGMNSQAGARDSVRYIVRGKGAGLFWGVVGGGLLAGMVFDYCVAYIPLLPSASLMAAAVPVSLAGLASGFMLRYLIVSAGISLPLNVEGTSVSIPKLTRGEFYLKDQSR